MTIADILKVIKIREKQPTLRYIIFSYRILLALFSWTVLGIMFYRSVIRQSDIAAGILAGISSYRYYTMQTNLFVALWYSFAVFFQFKPELLNKIRGGLKGALALYITITFIVFAVMLSESYQPTGIDSFTNISSHYIVPILFIVDWFLAEWDVKYRWLYLAFWVIYPLCYLIFAVLHGNYISSGNYLYPFLNLQNLGWVKFIISVLVLVVVFLSLGSLYIGMNRIIRLIMTKKQQENNENKTMVGDIEQSEEREEDH